MDGRKFLWLAVAVFSLGSTPFLTGCQKDYDGQLEILRNQINNGMINLDGLKEKVTLIEQQLTVLEQAIADGDTANKEEIEQLKTELEQLKSDLNARITELQGKIDANSDDIRDIQTQIEETNKQFDAKLLEMSEKINQLDAALNVLDGRVTKLEEQVASLQEKQQAVEQTIEGLKQEIATLGEDMEGQKTKLEQALTQLEALDEKLTTEITRVESLVNEVKTATEENAANLEELRSSTIESITSLKKDVDARLQDLTNQMAGLSESVAALGDKVSDLNQKYDNLSEDLNKLEDKYNLQIQKIWEAINGMTPGDDEALEELKKLVNELQTNLNELRDSMNEELKKMLDTQELFGKDLQDVKATVEDHNRRISDLAQKMDALGIRVTKLEETVKNRQNAYQLTISEIEDRLKALEEQAGDFDPETLELMKKDLQALKEEVNKQAQSILALQNQQEVQARKLVELSDYVQESVLALQTNYNNLNRKVTEMDAFISLLDKNLKDTQGAVAGLTETVNQHASQINDLYRKIENLQQEQGKYVTREEVEKILDNYYDKSEMDSVLTEVYRKINACPTLDDVNRVVEEAAEKMQTQLDQMQQSIDQLNMQLADLNKQVEMLMNRIQSFELLADYSDGSVMVTDESAGKYVMTLKVEITPEEALNELKDLKGIVGVRYKSVIPVRGASELPAMQVENVTAANGVLEVKVSFALQQMPAEGNLMPYQVAVVLDDNNNHKLSEYRTLRMKTADVVDDGVTYTFMKGQETLFAKEDIAISLFQPAEIYQLPVLKTMDNQHGSELCQIDGQPALFDASVTASSTLAGSANVNLPVVYSLAAIYDPQNNTRGDLWNYIEVSTAGQISMKNNLTPGVTPVSLEGYKVVVGLQARKNGQDFGKRGYVCFYLQKK